jgi:HK97 gp10 family phage protein
MARAKFHLDGFKELRALLRDKAPKESRNLLRATVHGVAVRARDEMKRRVKVDDGDLKKSIKAVRRRGEPDAPVSDVRGGATAPYALMLEYGTSKTRAQPFITPTVESMRPGLSNVYREEYVDKLVKSIARAAKKKAMT